MGITLIKTNKIFIVVLLISINLCALCYAQEFQAFLGQVNTNGINVRSDSTVSSEAICKINKGEQVEVILALYEWYKIRLPKSAPSFINKSLVMPIDDRGAKVLKDMVNIRLHPSESSSILGQVNRGEIIHILQDRDQWYRIEPVNNSYGWIHNKFIDKILTRETLVETKTEALD